MPLTRMTILLRVRFARCEPLGRRGDSSMINGMEVQGE